MAQPYQPPHAPHQQLGNLPPLQPPPRNYPPSPYQQSPGAMSPVGVPPAKRQRLSPNPPSPYGQSPYPVSPYASSPPGGTYLSPLPTTPASAQAPHSFHQPQPYQSINDINSRPQPNVMGPPAVPYSRTQDNTELEKTDARANDINQLSDVLSGAGVDLRAEEDNLLLNWRNSQQGQQPGTSFNSQTSSTVSPNNSFNQWGQGQGAFQGTGPLSQPVSAKDQAAELNRKHQDAAREFAEASQFHLSDPFLGASTVRAKLTNKSYESGISLNVEGLYDPQNLPRQPHNVTARTTQVGPNGETIRNLEGESLPSILNRNAPLVDIITLISLATQERLRGFLEDAYAVSRGRQATADGVVPPEWEKLAVGSGNPQKTTAIPANISNTSWEEPPSAVSPMTVAGQKRDYNGVTRLPTPPTDAPPTPQPTISFSNTLATSLKRLASRDRSFEEERLAKRQKRLRASTAASAETPVAPIIPLPEKMTKKERDRLNKMGQTDDVLHRKANETARMALGGGSKKYSWMSGGAGRGSGASTPARINTAVSGTSTPSGAPVVPERDRALVARDRKFGSFKESGPQGKNIQIRDLIHVLEHDGKEKKALVTILAKMKSTDT